MRTSSSSVLDDSVSYVSYRSIVGVLGGLWIANREVAYPLS